MECFVGGGILLCNSVEWVDVIFNVGRRFDSCYWQVISYTPAQVFNDKQSKFSIVQFTWRSKIFIRRQIEQILTAVKINNRVF